MSPRLLLHNPPLRANAFKMQGFAGAQLGLVVGLITLDERDGGPVLLDANPWLFDVDAQASSSHDAISALFFPRRLRQTLG